MATSHFNLPEFAETGTADLLGIYNKAVETIDSQLYSAYQEAIAASAAASKAQSTADTGNATANGAVAVNNKQNTDISSLQATIENLRIFNPTSAQLAAMNSGVTSKTLTTYKAQLQNESNVSGSIVFTRIGRVCFTNIFSLQSSVGFDANSTICNIPMGFNPSQTVGTMIAGESGTNYELFFTKGKIMVTGYKAIKANDRLYAFFAYLAENTYPDDSYIVV